MMLKKLIPAAALLALTGAAQAQVSIYGLVDLSYGKNETLATANDRKATLHSGGDNGGSQGNSVTRVGLKGSMDVGSGLKGNFKLESGGIDMDGKVNNGDAFFDRQAWAGLSGGFGEVRVGRQDSVVFQTSIAFDLNGASNAACATCNSGIANGVLGKGRYSRQIQYIAPTVNGFTVQVGYAAIDTAAAVAATSKAAGAVGVTYAAGPLTLAAATEAARVTGGSSSSVYAGSYDFGVAKVALSYTPSKNSDGVDAKGTMIGVVAPIAGYNVGMQYAKNSDTKAKGTEFFVNKEVLKNTSVYFDYGIKKEVGVESKNTYALGAIYVF
jgi:predicted porin